MIDAGAAIISVALGVLVGLGIGALSSPAVAKLRAAPRGGAGHGGRSGARAGRDR